MDTPTFRSHLRSADTFRAFVFQLTPGNRRFSTGGGGRGDGAPNGTHRCWTIQIVSVIHLTIGRLGARRANTGTAVVSEETCLIRASERASAVTPLPHRGRRNRVTSAPRRTQDDCPVYRWLFSEHRLSHDSARHKSQWTA